MLDEPCAFAAGTVSMPDRFIPEFDRALRAVAGITRASAPTPPTPSSPTPTTAQNCPKPSAAMPPG